VKNLLLIKAGDLANPVRRVHGDYDRWFHDALGGDGVRYRTVHAHLGERLPHSAALDAVIVTGSPLSVTELAPWMRRTADWLLAAGDRGLPILGVCFGHQLLAHAHGVKVRKSPQGREIGTIRVRLTAAGRSDPLFAGLDPELTVQATHEDEAAELPASAVLLGTNAACAIQAFGVGSNVRAVQFHPELSPAGMRAIIQARAEKLETEAVARGDIAGEKVRRLLAGIAPSPQGPRLLRNFVERF
jgi:GMP synthase (glutamine-hydrolysing)